MVHLSRLTIILLDPGPVGARIIYNLHTLQVFRWSFFATDIKISHVLCIEEIIQVYLELVSFLIWYQFNLLFFK